MNVTRRDYVCTACGYHEEFIVETEALEKIAELAAGNIKGWEQVPRLRSIDELTRQCLPE